MTMLDAQGNTKPLVERLRQAEQEGREIIEPWDHDPYLYGEAADNIERLCGTLEAIVAETDCSHAEALARHALGKLE